MKPLRESRTSELASLQMENELLTHETRFLRARLAQAHRRAGKTGEQAALERRLQRCRARLAEETKERKKLRRRLKRREKRLAAAQPALEDLRWLLRRLDSSPVGPLLRRKQGFRVLCERYDVR